MTSASSNQGDAEKPVGEPQEPTHFALEDEPPQTATAHAPRAARDIFEAAPNPTTAANAAIAAADKLAEDAVRPLGPPIIPAFPRLAKPLVFVGVGLVLAAAIIAGVNAEKNHGAHIVRALYGTALHSALGVAAAYALARIEHRALGSWQEAWARTFVAVAAFQVCLHLKIGPTATKAEEALLGVTVYFVSLIFLLKWSLVRVLHLAMLQFLAWGIIALSTIFHTWASTVPDAAGK
jgi:hypothetical protein